MDYSGSDHLDVMAGALNYNEALHRLVLTALPTSAKDIVDFGAGSGTFASKMRDAGYPVTCIEPAQNLAKLLGSKGLATLPTLYSLDLQSVDFLYSLNVLEHIADEAAALDLCFQKMRLGGVILFYVPAFHVLFTSMDTAVGHHRRYRRHSLATAIQNAGFTIVTTRYADSLGFLASLYLKWTDRGHGTLHPGMVRFYDRAIFPLSLIMDRLCNRWFGKNVYVVARKDAHGRNCQSRRQVDNSESVPPMHAYKADK
ncbi:class I SAM-dependent methyltransferase [Acidithiobacillus ferrivorans]|nr:class I SAM-dependent methyltransferase [Acidithiobacillus ferrivorans]